MRSPSSIT